MICTHGYASPASCLDCMEDGPVVPPPSPEHALRTIVARHPGFCPRQVGCGEDIEPGDRISLLDPSGLWVHEDCAP